MSKERKPFVDFRAIRARVTMEQLLERYGLLHTFKRSGPRLSGPCPIHNGSNPTQFRVDTDKNLWNCFSECKHGGNVLDFIAKKEDISIHDARFERASGLISRLMRSRQPACRMRRACGCETAARKHCQVWQASPSPGKHRAESRRSNSGWTSWIVRIRILRSAESPSRR